MIQFVLSHDAIFDPAQDKVLDYLYTQMPNYTATFWVEHASNCTRVFEWAASLFPRRIVAIHAVTRPKDFKQGVIHLITPEHLTDICENCLLVSRDVLIPPNIPYGALIHWVDQQREHSREYYRTYQKNGLKPHTLTL